MYFVYGIIFIFILFCCTNSIVLNGGGSGA